MLDSLLTFINQHAKSLQKQRCLLAVSGGVDSVVLAHLFHKSGIKCMIAHCNFGLRGEESDGDQAFVESLAAQYGFEFICRQFEVKKFAKEEKISTQMAARTMRYAWFEEIRAARGLDWIVTAHHAGDLLETTILNLTRGTGIAGLPGIMPVNGALLRPLLTTTREQIVCYATDNGLVWREDSSNNSDIYARNLVRHKVVPVLTSINPSLQTTFLDTAERLRSAGMLVTEMLEQWVQSAVVHQEGLLKISIPQLKQVSENVYRLWFILSNYGFHYGQVRQIAERIYATGKIFTSATHQLLVDREYLLVTKMVAPQPSDIVEIHEFGTNYRLGNLVFSLHENAAFDELALKDPHRMYVAREKLIFPLRVRQWQGGDTFTPFGMGGKKKKVSDLLIDQKVNRLKKSNVVVMLNGNNELAWVVGLRTDERYRIFSETQNLVLIRAMVT